MAENTSKTSVSVYTNRKGIKRIQVSFDASKLTETGGIGKDLLAEITAAIKAAQERQA